MRIKVHEIKEKILSRMHMSTVVIGVGHSGDVVSQYRFHHDIFDGGQYRRSSETEADIRKILDSVKRSWDHMMVYNVLDNAIVDPALVGTIQIKGVSKKCVVGQYNSIFGIEKKEKNNSITVHAFYISDAGIVKMKRIKIENVAEPYEFLVDDGSGFPATRYHVYSQPDGDGVVCDIIYPCQKLGNVFVFFCRTVHQAEYTVVSKKTFDERKVLLAKKIKFSGMLRDKNLFTCGINLVNPNKITKIEQKEICEQYTEFLEKRTHE